MCSVVGVFCFKQKTAYELRISDWSSDVCSSDLSWPGRKQGTGRKHHLVVRCPRECQVFHVRACLSPAVYPGGRSVVSGKLATRTAIIALASGARKSVV